MGPPAAAEPRQEVKRHGRLPFIKKRGVRRPALRELFRPVSTPAEVRLFVELYARHSSKPSTNWANMCQEWNQRAALTISHVSGADNAIHQKNIVLLKKYEKELVTGILRKDSLNSLHAYHSFSMQPTANHSPLPTIHPNHVFHAQLPHITGHGLGPFTHMTHPTYPSLFTQPNQ